LAEAYAERGNARRSVRDLRLEQLSASLKVTAPGPDVIESAVTESSQLALWQGRLVETLDPLTERLGLGAISLVLLLQVPEAELVKRISGRREESSAGERSDDREEVVRERLRVYRRDTEPLVDYYRARGVLEQIDGVGSVDEVFMRLDEAMRMAVQA